MEEGWSRAAVTPALPSWSLSTSEDSGKRKEEGGGVGGRKVLTHTHTHTHTHHPQTPAWPVNDGRENLRMKMRIETVLNWGVYALKTSANLVHASWESSQGSPWGLRDGGWIPRWEGRNPVSCLSPVSSDWWTNWLEDHHGDHRGY